MFRSPLNILGLVMSLLSKFKAILLFSIGSIAFSSHALTVTGLIEQSQVTPSTMCLQTDLNFDNYPKNVNLDNYFELFLNKQKVKNNVYLNKNLICLGSLEHGQNYTLTIKKGLPLGVSNKLEEGFNYNFTTSDAKPSLYLESGQFLVNDKQDLGLNLTTTNIESLDIKIFKIPSEILTNFNLISYLGSQKNLDAYSLAALNQKGSLVYSHKLVINAKKNQNIVTKLDLKQQTIGSGIYVILATNPLDSKYDLDSFYYEHKYPYAAKLLFISDLGISSYYGANNLLVSVRSITSGKTLDKVKVSLLSENNQVLQTIKTDKQGFARFDGKLLKGKYGSRPYAVIANYKDDLCSMVLDTPSLAILNEGKDLKLNKFDVFTYTDRGIYKRGQTIHYNALIRDYNLNAVANQAVILKILNPRGIEYAKVKLDDNNQYVYSYDFNVPQQALLGMWSFALYIGDTLIDSKFLSVSDFVPQKLNINIDYDDDFLDKAGYINLTSTFNYGAPASNLPAFAKIKLEANIHPLKQYQDYFFGATDEDLGSKLEFYDLGTTTTNIDGQASFVYTIDDSEFPRNAIIQTEVSDTGNQNITQTLIKPIKMDNHLIGVKKLKAPANIALFKLLVCNQSGLLTDEDLTYSVYKRNTFYQYVNENDRWIYKEFKSRSLISTGIFEYRSNKDKHDLQLELENGSYTLELIGSDSKTIFNFYQGYYDDERSDYSPQHILIASDRNFYQYGDNVTLSFESPYDGFANVVLASNKIYDFKSIKVHQGLNKYSFKAKSEFGPGVHVMLSTFAPYAQYKNKDLRQVGMLYVRFDEQDRVLKIKSNFDFAKRYSSGQKIKIPVEIENAKGDVYFTAALVDNGILALNNYQFEKLDTYFLQKRKNLVNIHDMYGFLVDRVNSLNQGYGDEGSYFSAQSLSVDPNRTFVLYQGVSKIKDGKTTIEFDLPLFDGGAKLMLNAWNKEQFGSFTNELLIANHVVSSLSLPQFLGPEDESNGRINLHNLEGLDKDFKLEVNCEGNLACDFNQDVTLDKGQRSDIFFNIKATGVGVGTVNFKTISDHFNFTDSYKLQVRAPYPHTLQSKLNILNAGEHKSVTFVGEYFKPYMIKTVYGTLPYVNKPLFIEYLDNDYYASLNETSASLISYLLLFSNQDPKYNQKIQNLVDLIVSAQTYEGDFGYAGSYVSSPNYQSILATYALLKAKDHHFYVNADVLNRALNYVRNLAKNGTFEEQAYAYSVLSQFEGVEASDLRYFCDENLDKITDPRSLSNLAYALYFNGDKNRANLVVDKALSSLEQWFTQIHALVNTQSKELYFNIYNQILSLYNKVPATNINADSFMLIKLLALLNRDSEINTVLEYLMRMNLKSEDLNSISMLDILEADALFNQDDNYQFKNQSDQDKLTIKLENDSDSRVFASSVLYAISEHPQEQVNNGMQVIKVIYDKEGNELGSGETIALNDKIFVHVHIDRNSFVGNNLKLLDYLPAGFELLDVEVKSNQLPFKADFEISEQKYVNTADKILFTLPNYFYNVFDIVYVMRAAIPGTYQLGIGVAYLDNNAKVNGTSANLGKIIIE